MACFLKYAAKKCIDKNRWLQTLTSEKCTVPLKDWMAASILILPLKERTAQKMKFSIKDFFSKCFPQETADLVTFTEEILNGKLHFLCSDA